MNKCIIFPSIGTFFSDLCKWFKQTTSLASGPCFSPENLSDEDIHEIMNIIQPIMNRRIITIIIALAAITAWAQEKQSKIGYVTMSNIDNYITIDTATVRVWYALNALDIKDENTYIDWQILEVGSHCNKYYSYFVWESDSLRTVDRRTNRSGNFSKKLLPRGRNGYGNWNELQSAAI